ncbi:hypothetical protein LARV_00806 [Longilinea arvoryzae]|uniref:Streptomycin adenylyltransferase n=1 Tax=Longilinea arvoryzae TaxID=360412 RepID=A0A0S7BG21_9CHLR|nr:hypothetical protein [Longilinea arvoryzae]GAP13064.1 hypothetical protein LARV_00806 [Longilinea arvoryzae]
MNSPEVLLARLEAIARSLENSGHAEALISCGSVGIELDRLDTYSDLDFFAVVEEGWKEHYITHLDWLEKVAPVVYAFRNTVDGFKLLFADGIFCEFAVFERGELLRVPYAPGRIVWKRPDVPDSIANPTVAGGAPEEKSVDWLLGEALTNLYVGLCRYRRGEKLSAARFIQGYAVDRVVDLAGSIETEGPAPKDIFSGERRFEARFPVIAQLLPGMLPGYERTPESALAILTFLEQHFPVNQALADRIRELAGSGIPG